MGLIRSSVYDRLRYETRPSAHTHPDRLATLAMLFGIEPAPVQRCRVLELGCGNGGNLLPIAAELPASRFVGIDNAEVPVVAARGRAAALGLTNIEFEERDLLDLDASLGQFDYIIAHGVYSWVPEPVRDKLLEICRSNLAGNGVAYVSYNTYPGCYQRDMVREMMLYRIQGIAEPEARLDQAREFVEFLAGAAPGPPALRDELQTVRERKRWAVYHDDLCETYKPVYFHEFAGQARRHGLQFLAEAQFSSMHEGAFPPPVAAELRRLAGGDRIRKQQYLDFLRCRRFRRTLLCHEGIRLPEEPSPRAIRRLFAASAAQPVSPGAGLRSSAEEEFRLEDGASMKTTLPFAKAALSILASCWPAALRFDQLLGSIHAALGEEKPGDGELLAEFLLRTYSCGLVELHAAPFRFTVAVSERPRAFALARLEVGQGPIVSTLAHGYADIEDRLARRLLLLLDGTRDRAALLRELQASPESAGMPAVTAEDLERNLARSARLGLLEA